MLRGSSKLLYRIMRFHAASSVKSIPSSFEKALCFIIISSSNPGSFIQLKLCFCIFFLYVENYNLFFAETSWGLHISDSESRDTISVQ